jgi:hypothetical protein
MKEGTDQRADTGAAPTAAPGTRFVDKSNNTVKVTPTANDKQLANLLYKGDIKKAVSVRLAAEKRKEA